MMGAVWMRFRAELRTRQRALIALVLLAGVPAGVAIAAASGAARTDSVADRLVARTRPPLIYLPTYFQETKPAFEDVARLPVVSEAFLIHSYASERDLEISAPVGAGLADDRTHLLGGRLPRPDRPEEATVNFRAVERYHWKIGQVVPLELAGRGSNILSGEIVPGPSLAAKIVGITADAGDFVGIADPGMTFGSAFSRRYDAQSATLDLFVFSLKRGAADIPAFNDSLYQLTGGEPLLYADARSGLAQVRRAFRLQGAALWILAATVGLVSALIFTQAAARHALLQSPGDRTLLALGLTRADLTRIAVARGATLAVGATGLAATIAAALSPIFPLGTPHHAEPHPGLSLPVATFGVGVASVAALVLALASASSVLASRSAVDRASGKRARPSAVARAMSVLTRRPAPAIGARFALEPGHGATAVPVRTSLTAAITGIIALLAALTAGASMKHVLATPSLYGLNWDLERPGDFAPGSKDLNDLIADPAVASAAVGTGGEGANFQVDHGSRTASMTGVNVDSVKGKLEPRLLSGRTPEAADEIAFGPKTLESLGARIGSTVRVGIIGTPRRFSRNFRVVGEAVLPFDDDITGTGEGLWLTFAGMQPLFPRAPRDTALIRFAPGVDRDAAIARLTKRFPSEDESGRFIPRSIQSMQRLSGLAVALATILAALAAGTLAHMLATSIRRRRRDLAILRTMGFSTGQVRSAVGWQAIIFVAVGIVIAVPLGIAAGRWTWKLIARYGGFAPAPAVPALQIVIVVAGALMVAVLLAAMPARSAARTRPALVLRSE